MTTPLASYQIVNIEYPVTDVPREAFAAGYQVEFADQKVFLSQETIKSIELLSITFESKMKESKTHCIALKDYTHEEFTNIINLYFNEGFVYELLDENQLKSPDCIESIANRISFFFPTQYEKRLTALTQEFRLLPYAFYIEIIKNYKESLAFKQEEGEKEKEFSFTPKLVQIAEEMITTACADYSEKTFDEKLIYYRELACYDKKIQQKELALSGARTEIKKNFLLAEINALVKRRGSITYDLETHSWSKSSRVRGLRQLINLPEELTTPRICELKEKAKRELEEYADKVSKFTNANEELIPYLIGPEAYLLDYYELEPQEKGFKTSSPSRYFESLNLASFPPYFAERRIAQLTDKCKRNMVRITQPREKLVGEEGKIHDILNRWMTCLDEEVVIVKNFLIKKTNSKMTPKDFTLGKSDDSEMIYNCYRQGKDCFAQFLIGEWVIRDIKTSLPVP